MVRRHVSSTQTACPNWLEATLTMRFSDVLAGETRRPTRAALHVVRVSLAEGTARLTVSATQLAMQRLSVHGVSGILSARRVSATPQLRHAQKLVEAVEVTWAVPTADAVSRFADVAIDSGV